MADDDNGSVPVTTREKEPTPTITAMTTTMGGAPGRLGRFWRESYSWSYTPCCTKECRTTTPDPRLPAYEQRYSSHYPEEYRKGAKSEEMQTEWVQQEYLVQNKELCQDMQEMVFDIPQLIMDAVKHEMCALLPNRERGKGQDLPCNGAQAKDQPCEMLDTTFDADKLVFFLLQVYTF
ncbi:UNVERIFIED_CONTAM: hypothetical protein K2H54_057281 [Gekko kuhli]